VKKFKATFLFCFVLIALLFVGCEHKNDYNPVVPIISQNEQLANVTFKIIGPDGNTGLKASTSGDSAEVTVSFKLLRPDSPNDFHLVQKVAPVKNGQAEFIFYSLPARLAVANIEIKNGKIGDYSKFRGAQTLKSGENNVFLIAGVNSFETPDLIAGTIDELLIERKISDTTTENIVLDITSASSKVLKEVEPNKAGLVKNIAAIYLFNKSANFSTKVVNVYKRHLMQFILTVIDSSQNALKNANQFNGWVWSDADQFWTYFKSLSSDANYLQTFSFTDRNLNSYKTKTGSAEINGFKYGYIAATNSQEGPIKVSENYFFTDRTDGGLDVFGNYKGYLKSAQIIQITPENLVVSTLQPYPLSGSLRVNLFALGEMVISFNGTCVADSVYSDPLKQTVSAKLFLEKYSILNQSYITEINLKCSASGI
jgi:hypothetical protein